MSTGIPYLDEVWNVTTGCTPRSPACQNCYAKRMTERNLWGYDFTPRFHPERLEQPLHWRKPRVIGVSFMGDIMAKGITDAQRDQIWSVMGCCEQPDMRMHTFVLLTKRPYSMLAYACLRGSSGMVFDLPNLWLGVTAWDSASAFENLCALLQTPATVRWLSYEPALGPLNMKPYTAKGRTRLDWVVCGPETGPGKRPFDLDWARSARDQCVAAGIPFWYKGGELDGKTWEQRPER